MMAFYPGGVMMAFYRIGGGQAQTGWQNASRIWISPQILPPNML
jgi:hypothetical protein